MRKLGTKSKSKVGLGYYANWIYNAY